MLNKNRQTFVVPPETNNHQLNQLKQHTNVKGQRLGAMLCYNDDDERTTNFDNNRPDCDAMMLWRPRDDCFQINLTFANLIRNGQPNSQVKPSETINDLTN